MFFPLFWDYCELFGCISSYFFHEQSKLYTNGDDGGQDCDSDRLLTSKVSGQYGHQDKDE